jgi:1-acyl-sn-glycerol-3-phosphate acyltransferase
MSEVLYRVARWLLTWSVRLYYRKVEVADGGRIPEQGAVILVANHPNSSADAFLLGSHLTKRRINFIAKDTITSAPVVGWMVRQCGLVGVARALEYPNRRDVARQRNEAAISTCMPRLLAGGVLAIFGEGISTDARRLSVVRKGAMRFGYAAEKAADFKLGLKWIPVGINYSAKQRFRSDVLIRVGQPFTVHELESAPEEHEAQVLQRGTDRLQRELESLVVNIEKEELAGVIDRAAALVVGLEASLDETLAAHQAMARAVQYFNVAAPERVRHLEQALRRYDRTLRAVELSDEVVRQRHAKDALRRSTLALVRNCGLLVLNAYGWFNSLVPRWTAALARPFGHTTTDGLTNTTKQALFATVGGWIGAAIAFPLQVYLVATWTAARYGQPVGMAVGAAYALTLAPSWLLFVRRRDVVRRHGENAVNALRFLLGASAAGRLRRQRRKLARQARELLQAYAGEGPREAVARPIDTRIPAR